MAAIQDLVLTFCLKRHWNSWCLYSSQPASLTMSFFLSLLKNHFALAQLYIFEKRMPELNVLPIIWCLL